MIIARRLPLFLSVFAAVTACYSLCLSAQDASESAQFAGKPLTHWVAQATAENGPSDPDATVSALIEAVQSDDPNAKRDAADALAALGPKAKKALPALLAQFGDERPWVRVSCQAAVGSMGKDAVSALVDTFENNTGGPRLRAAFVLGGIGADAKPAVPVILRIMKEEAPVMQERMAGVLGQIDPERFSPQGPAGRARYETTESQLPAEVATTDWPQFHGPARDSICREKGLLQAWPEGGPELLWTLKGLGRGYSTISIADGRLFTMGDRPDASGSEMQFVIVFDLGSRKELWATPAGPPHTDGGPRCTPTVEGPLLYAIGTDGDLVCLETESGNVRWRKSFVDDFEGKFMSVWKFSESPLVDGDRLICTPGGPEAMMVALNKHTGELIWKCALPEMGAKGVDGAGYSSAVAADIGGVRQYVQLVGRGVFGVEAATGRFLWGYNQVANTVANITAPVVRGDYVFATTAYNTGSALLKISRDGDAFRADEVYFLSSRDFQNHHGGVVLLGDYIYGGHGPNKGDPACVELGTGKVVWKERAPATGSAGVLYADGHLVFRYDRGTVVLIEATPEALRIKGQFQAPDGDGPAWAHPVIHNSKLYLRHADLLFCYDLSSSS
jgi:outer membrane protein assembly factor BamB